MPISANIYTVDQLNTAFAHDLAGSVVGDNALFLEAHADDYAGDAPAAAIATNTQLVQIIQYHAEYFFLSEDTTYQSQALFAAAELAAEWPRGLTDHQITSTLPIPVICNLTKAATLDPDLYDTLEPIFDACLAEIFAGTLSETGFGGLLGIRAQLGLVRGTGVDAFADYGANIGLNTMLTSTYIHSTGHVNWWPGSSWYVISNVPFWLRQAGETVKDSMTAGQRTLYDLACRIAIPFTWHGITLYIGEDVDVGRGASHADYPTVGYPWYHVDDDDEAKWLRYHGYQQIINGERSLAFEDLLVPNQTTDPGYPVHDVATDVVLGEHLLITYGNCLARIKQVNNGSEVIGSHTTDSALPQIAYFNDDGFISRTFGADPTISDNDDCLPDTGDTILVSQTSTGSPLIKNDFIVLEPNVDVSGTHLETHYQIFEKQSPLTTPLISIKSGQNIRTNGNVSVLTKDELKIVLTFNKQYKIRIRTRNESGWGAWSEVVEFKTRDKDYKYTRPVN